MDSTRSDKMGKHPVSSYPSSRRTQTEGFPSRVLMICYPSSVIIDEHKLHEQVILFGEIEGIQSFPLENYSLVKFRSIEDARRAKDGLCGKLFNNPKIIIMYSNNENAPTPTPTPTPTPPPSSSNTPNRRRLSLAPSEPISVKRPHVNQHRVLEYKIPRQTSGFDGYIWRGVISKGGSPVCHARCVPFGKGILSNVPEVINCSARIGLENLTKYYVNAVGSDVVFFLPNSKEDSQSYSNFLHYLGDKNRAGIAKLDDITTLFLVPPSDFLTKVLNMVGPKRCVYGVVLKFPQFPKTIPLHQYINNGHQMFNSAESSKTTLTPIVGGNVQTITQISPHNHPPIALPVPQPPPFYPTPIPEQNQSYYQAPPPPPPPPHPFQGFPTTSSGQPMVHHSQNHFRHLPAIVRSISYEPSTTNSIIPFQGGHPSQVDQTQRFHGIPHNEHKEYGVEEGINGQSLHQETRDSVAFSNSVNQPHNVVSSSAVNVTPEVPNQVQPSPCGVSQETLQSATRIQQQESGTQTGQVPPSN